MFLFVCISSILYLFWFFLSGKTEPFYLTVGFIISLLIAYIGLFSRIHKSFKTKPIAFLIQGLRLIRYALWLLTRIVLAAISVSKIVLNPKMPIAPKVIRHKTSLKSNSAKIIFANSITLTPGTITVDIEGDHLIVHELDEASAGDIVSGLMELQIAKVFR